MTDFELYSDALQVQDGQLIWKIKPSARTSLGAIAGTPNHDGYVRVGFKRKMVFAHRIVWLLTYGEWPQGEIDHVNGQRNDNRPENLRVVSRKENMQNQRCAHKTNRTGALGVRKTSNSSQDRWYASIRADGRTHYLGVVDSVEAAKDLYITAKRRLHEGCTL